MKTENKKSLSEAKLRYSFPKNVKFHFYSAFWAILGFWQNFEILQLTWTLTPNKFWTKCLMPDFQPNNSIPPITTFIFIWLQLNHNGSLNLLKNFSQLNFLAILPLCFLKKKKKWNFYFYVICIILLSTMNPEKMKSLSKVKMR